MAAAQEGHFKVCKLLVKNGADPNAKDDEDRTVLMCAAGSGNKALCRWLVDEKGADVNAKDVNGVTLSEYVENTEGLERIAKFLKSRNKSP